MAIKLISCKMNRLGEYDIRIEVEKRFQAGRWSLGG
jgi:hypothetical protein